MARQARLTPPAGHEPDVKRVAATPRRDWRERVEQLGLLYHTGATPYWDESAYYAFTATEIGVLETATNDVHAMCLEAVQQVIDGHRWDELAISPLARVLIERSWNEEPPSLYGRFDLAYDGSGPPKLLEYNADTPTALLEAAVVQWQWLQDVAPSTDQFNSIHERLVQGWRELALSLPGRALHVATVDDWEDAITATYLRDVAEQAGLSTVQLRVEDIGWNSARRRFVDLAERDIDTIFKLYPWEWLVSEDFSVHLLDAISTTRWIEPAWKMVLSNKGILAVLWELHPGHENLLECHREQAGLAEYARKPLLSREGANVTLVSPSRGLAEGIDAGYGGEGFVYQALAPTSRFDNRFPVIGSWVIKGESAGIGIRESDRPITDNSSRFLPHLFE